MADSGPFEEGGSDSSDAVGRADFCASSNRYDPESTSNPYGKYGSRYSPNSINNPNGQYGSPYSQQSPNNPFGRGPSVVDDDD
jgi:hypothetical protein